MKTDSKETNHQKNTRKRLNLIWFLITIAVFTVFLIIYHVRTPFVFSTNDDLFIRQIVSGEVTGHPESHLLHIGYLSGLLLKLLYTILPSVAWYGWLLCGSFILGITLFVTGLESLCRNNLTRFLVLVGSLVFFRLLLLQHIVTIQFTTVTIITAACSLFLFYIQKDETAPFSYLGQNAPGLALFFIALNIRSEGAVMLLPLFFFLGCAKAIHNKKLIKSLALYAGCLLGCILLVLGINKLSEHGSEWNTYRSYNTARATIYDYNGFPTYEENRELYDSLGISYQSYISASTRYQLLLDEQINETSMNALADVSGKAAHSGFLDSCAQFVDLSVKSYIDRPLNLIVFLSYLLVLFLILITGRFYVLFDLSGLVAGRMCIWGYLMYLGRVVPRVTQGVYVAELLLLVGMVFYFRLWTPRPSNAGIPDSSMQNQQTGSVDVDSHHKVRKAFCLTAAIASLILAAACSVKFGLPYVRAAESTAISGVSYQTVFHEIQNYFRRSPDTLYLLDVNSFSYFTEDIFQKNTPSSANSILLGGWQAKSPWYDKVLKNRGIQSIEMDCIDNPDICFVFMDTDNTGMEYLENYYKENHPNILMDVCDTVDTSAGIRFLICHVISE